MQFTIEPHYASFDQTACFMGMLKNRNSTRSRRERTTLIENTARASDAHAHKKRRTPPERPPVVPVQALNWHDLFCTQHLCEPLFENADHEASCHVFVQCRELRNFEGNSRTFSQ